MNLASLPLSLPLQEELATLQHKPWFGELVNFLTLDPESLPEVGGFSSLFEEVEEQESKPWSPGYPLDLIENPVLHFSLLSLGQGGVRKYYLDCGSIFEGQHVKALDLETRKVSNLPHGLLSDLFHRGFTCSYHCTVVRLPWAQLTRAVHSDLVQGYVCKVEYLTRADRAGSGAVMRRAASLLKDVALQEDGKEWEEGAVRDAVHSLVAQRVQSGHYTFLRGYLFHEGRSKPRTKTFVDADQWAALKGGAKARRKCLVELPVRRIRAITVRNTKYIVSDFEL